MSHLGELLSAYLDGELDGAEQDKASAHLARCEECRAEAAGLRELKRQLGALGQASGEADIIQRLLPTPAGDFPAGRIPAGKTAIRRPRMLPRPARGPGGSSGPARFGKIRHRRRLLMLGTVTIVMGLSTAAFSVGGSDPAPGPKIVPQVELYSEEHAITTGGLPFGGTSQAVIQGADPTTSPAASLVTSGAARQP
jgi:hypothetical protein